MVATAQAGGDGRAGRGTAVVLLHGTELNIAAPAATECAVPGR